MQVLVTVHTQPTHPMPAQEEVIIELLTDESVFFGPP